MVNINSGIETRGAGSLTSKSRGAVPPPSESLLPSIQIKVNELFWTLLTVLSPTQLINIVLSHELLVYLAVINICDPICCQNAPE